MANIRTAMWSVNIILLAALAYAASSTAAILLESMLVDDFPAPLKNQRQTISKTVRKSLPQREFQDILNVNMFKARRTLKTPVKAGAIASSPQATTAPDTLPLNITLTGTMVLGLASTAFIIGPDKRTEKFYRLMDCIPATDVPSKNCNPGQAKLVKITGHDITVEMHQKQYVVGLKKNEVANNSHPNINRRNRLGKKTNPRSRINARRGVDFKTSREGNNINMRIPSGEVEKAFENFSSIVNQARVVPFMVGGKPQGFQIRKIVPGSIYEKIGLKNADILKSVNGESLNNADQALKLFTLFRNETDISLEVERGGKLLTISYTIE